MRKVLTLVATLVVAAGVALAGAGTPASAAPRSASAAAPAAHSQAVSARPNCAGIECGGVPTVCGRACDGKDPSSYQVPNSGGFTCSEDATTKYHKAVFNGWVELRYSPGCRTAWTRGYNPPSGSAWTSIGGFSYYSNGSLRTSVYTNGTSTSGTFYTAMLDDANLVYKACKDTQVGGSPDWSCTSGW